MSIRAESIRSALAKATPGRWSVHPRSEGGYAGIRTTSFETTVAGTASGLSDADAEVIVLLHNAAADLIAGLEAMERVAVELSKIEPALSGDPTYDAVHKREKNV